VQLVYMYPSFLCGCVLSTINKDMMMMMSICFKTMWDLLFPL